MVVDCPMFSQIAQAFECYISGCNVVGHNLPFDLRFIYVCGCELSDKVRYYDTLKLAKLILKKSGSQQYDYHTGEYYRLDENDSNVEDYKLDTLCDYYSIRRSCSHRSLSDCLATVKLFENLIDDKIGAKINT
jgi:DNA polymerase III epsilon subunit-like protein